MRKLIFVMALSATMLSACNNEPPKKEEEKGVKIEGKKGGEMEMNKDKLEIEGKKGGEMKIDSNGVKINKSH